MTRCGGIPSLPNRDVNAGIVYSLLPSRFRFALLLLIICHSMQTPTILTEPRVFIESCVELRGSVESAKYSLRGRQRPRTSPLFSSLNAPRRWCATPCPSPSAASRRLRQLLRSFWPERPVGRQPPLQRAPARCARPIPDFAGARRRRPWHSGWRQGRPQQGQNLLPYGPRKTGVCPIQRHSRSAFHSAGECCRYALVARAACEIAGVLRASAAWLGTEEG